MDITGTLIVESEKAPIPYRNNVIVIVNGETFKARGAPIPYRNNKKIGRDSNIKRMYI